MLAEHAVVFDANDVVRVLRIVLLQVQQNLELHACLMLEFLLVSDDLDGYDLACLVIHALQGLSE